jgi:hypothetical protein
VRDAFRSEYSITKCFGETYDFHGEVLTATGEYNKTLKTVLGCDSIVTLHLTIRPEIRPTIINDVTCPGVPFTGHGWIGVPPVSGDYERPLVTPAGCDSLVILRLTVLDADTTIVTQIVFESALPITIHGITFEVGTPLGEHTDTISVSNSTGDCESVIIVILTVIEDEEKPIGLWNPSTSMLTVIPTVINRGESVQIIGTAEMGKLEVEVFNMLGQRVYLQEPTALPIQLSTFSTTGTYLIRAISENGQVMYGRVIVR